MSAFGDMKFSDRLKQACDRARPKIEWSQTALGRAFGVSKQTAERWMGDGKPSAETLFALSDTLEKSGVPYPFCAARWLATGEDAVSAVGMRPEQPRLEADELELALRYRDADPRWKLALRLLAALGAEAQVEVATDVNVIIARVLGKKPTEVRYATNERVAAAYGEAPHVAVRKKGVVR